MLASFKCRPQKSDWNVELEVSGTPKSLGWVLVHEVYQCPKIGSGANPIISHHSDIECLTQIKFPATVHPLLVSTRN